jgi:CHAT domain-containing protein
MRISQKAARLLAAFLFFISIEAKALSGNEQIELAGAGKYEELRQGLEALEAKSPLLTRDLHALCFAYSKTKRYNKLLPCLERLEANIGKGDLRTRLFGLDDATPVLHQMRAEAQLDLANYVIALTEAKKALDWYKSEDSDDQDIALNALAIMSIASTMSGKRGDGEKYAREIQDVGTFTLLGNGFVSVKAMAAARAHMALGNYQQVLDAFARDKMFALHVFLDRLVSGALITGKNNWAWQELPRAFMTNRALQGIGKAAEAKRGYDQLLSMSPVRENGEIYWQILFERGVIAEAEGELDAAAKFYRDAIEVVEQQRSTIHTESSKIGFIGDKQRVYNNVINLLYTQNRQQEAFEYIERSKSRALVDMLATKRASAIDPNASVETANALRELDEAEDELLAQVPVSAAEGKSVQRSITLKNVDRIRSIAPELGTLISVSVTPAKQIRHALPPAEVLVQYYYYDERLYASVFTRTDIHMFRLDAGSLEQDIKKFRAAIDNQEAEVEAFSKKLYDRLIRPLEEKFGQSKNLLIIPHGALHYLPFGALHDGRQFLLDRFVVRSLPSASVLEYMRGKSSRAAQRMIVFGNPDLGDSKYDLPSAQVEAEKIAISSGNAKLLLKKQATETFAKSIASDYRILHIASHGVFDNKVPLESALLLAKDQANDGKLTVGELYSLKLNADLVTLSACETGLGQINSGDDVIGLTRGFLYAGASSVVASLWQVDDEATSELMIRFYAELATKSKAEALRAAQLEVKKKFPDPYFWSAFYLTGNAS